MSLIALAQHMRRPRTFIRNLITLVAITAGIIIGLLAMHALNSHTAMPAESGVLALLVTLLLLARPTHWQVAINPQVRTGPPSTLGTEPGRRPHH